MVELGGLYDKIEVVYNELGAKVVIDSACCAQKSPGPIQSFASVVDASGRPRQHVQLYHDAMSVCQLSES